MIELGYSELLLLTLPSAIIVVAGFIALAIDLSVLRNSSIRLRFATSAFIACAGCLSAGLWVGVEQAHVHLVHGMLLCNSLTQLMQVSLLLLAGLAILLSVESGFTKHIGEYVLL